MAACSSQSDGGSSSGGGDTSALEAKAAKAIEAASAEQTNTPPADGPAPQPGKKILVVPCLAAADGCARPSKAAVAAGKAIGWDMNLVDGQYDPAKWNAAIVNAITQKYDGIILESIASDAIQGSIAKAKDAGIPIVCGACTDPKGLYSASIVGSDDFFAQGYLLAQFMYQYTKGDLNVLMMTSDEDGGTKLRREGTEKFIKECQAAGGKCEMKQQQFTVSQLGPDLASLTASAIRTDPNANIVWSGYDAASPYVIQGLATAGSKLQVGGFDANAQTADIIRQGKGEIVTIGNPYDWIGYAEVDALNRLFNGKPVADSGVTMKLLTKENLPPEGAWNGDSDVTAIYLKSWGK